MPNRIDELLKEYTNEMCRIFGSHLRTVILYGSYARGDYNEQSDIDIMMLVDLTDEEIKKYSDQVTDVTFDMNLDHDLMLMPIVKNQDHFNHWVQVYPFYSNVRNEGVPLYAA